MKKRLYCAEREKNSGAYYETIGVGLTIDCEYSGSIGKMVGWELVIAPDTTYTGTSKEDLMSTLHIIWPDMKWHKPTTRDKVMIMTDNIHKIQGFFESYITEAFDDHYVILDDFFEIRPCDRWMDESTAVGIAQQAQQIINDYFIPEKYFYITPQQRNRKLLSKKRDTSVASLSYPMSYDIYTRDRKAYFSGLLYMPYIGEKISEPMMVLDITSSYIFDLLIEKHVVSEPRRQKNLAMWEYYLSSATKASLGLYDITYCAPRTFISCYKDFDGNPLESGEHTVKMVLTSVDLKNLFSLGYIKKVEPIWLYEYDLGELPKYFMDEIVKSYVLKVQAVDKREKAIRKPILNGWYGDTIRKYDDAESFERTRKNPALSPMWGIFTTAYAKKYLLMLALDIDGWYYSDTDSIICKDTLENREKLVAFNQKIRKMVKNFCNTHGYDFEILKNLGTFKVEAEIDMMKVWACKTYVYRHLDGHVTLKAAGLVKSRVEVSEKLFDLKELDYTKMVFPLVVPASESSTGEGYYVEISPECKAQYYILMKLLRDHNKTLASK